MGIFHCYVSLPEGFWENSNPKTPKRSQKTSGLGICGSNLPRIFSVINRKHTTFKDRQRISTRNYGFFSESIMDFVVMILYVITEVFVGCNYSIVVIPKMTWSRGSQGNSELESIRAH